MKKGMKVNSRRKSMELLPLPSGMARPLLK
jgi:hypothetical protein